VFSAISPLTLHPLLSHDMRDPLRRVRPVASVMRTPVLVAGTPALPDNSFEALIDRARRFPGAVRWASSGVATIGHLVLAQVRLLSGTSITHVPYAGGGAQLNDALSGQFEVLSSNVAALQLQYIANGKLKALAVGSPRRVPALPDTPTLSELGYPQANLASLFGVFAPVETPEAVVQRLNAEINRVLASAPMMELLRKGYNIPAPGSPDAFAEEIAADRSRNRWVVDKVAGKLE
jgi:tripartite-type tricarboxylate transporter receptor subunit TctC